jgi:hypothetical protein
VTEGGKKRKSRGKRSLTKRMKVREREREREREKERERENKGKTCKDKGRQGKGGGGEVGSIDTDGLGGSGRSPDLIQRSPPISIACLSSLPLQTLSTGNCQSSDGETTARNTSRP